MDDPCVRTIHMLACLDRMRAGDGAARDELVRGFCERLERLARKMLRRFPGVQRWADTGDVLQNSLLRLLRALEEVRPTTTQAFFGLAAEQMRRELLDLVRHYYGRYGIGANHASRAALADPESPADDPPDLATDARELEKWCAFHEKVEQLPAAEREVVGLIFYHGWTQAEAAELFQVSVRTIQRRWEAALVKLHDTLKDERIDC
jgi:RNA polymerase sigma factor (sigma-70 family)